jgi:transcriptional regulator GlxA family with amidase domain
VVWFDKGRRSDSRAAAALSIIESHKGRVDIDRLAELAGMSIRQLERRFGERVGMSPKELCRILRFKNVFKHLAAYAADGWASTALACGYYDQSHMIRDFKHYAGTSPAAYFSGRRAGDRLFTGNF